MTLDELIEKLQAARVLVGEGATVMTNSDYGGGDRCQKVSRIQVCGDTVWVYYWNR